MKVIEKKGYVSADYVKGDKIVEAIKGKTDIKNTKTIETIPPVIAGKTKPKSNDKNDPVVVRDNGDKTKYIKEDKTSPAHLHRLLKDSDNKPVELQSVIDYQKKKSSESITGIGNKFNGGETLVDKNKLNEFNEKINKRQKNPSVKLITRFAQIWIDGARKAAGEQWSLGGLNKDKQHIEKGINSVVNKLNEILKDVTLTKDKINEKIKEIFKVMKKVENNNEDIIDNIEEVEKLFSGVDNSNYENKLAKILKLSAGGFRDGNTEKSKEIASEIVINKYFKSLAKQLDGITSIHDIKYDKFGILKLDDGTNVTLSKEEFSKLKEKAVEIYQNTLEANNNYKNSEIIRNKVKKENPSLTESDIDLLVSKINKASALINAKQFFLLKYTELAKDKINTTDPILKSYQNLDSGWQATQDFIGENGTMIALSLIPLGGGAALSGLIAKIGARAVNYLSKVKYIGRIGRGLEAMKGGQLATFAKGAIFYEGMNITNNILHLDVYKDWNIATTNHDIVELVKTASFFNVMKIANKFFPKGPKFYSAKTVSNFIAKTAGITGIDLSGEFYRNYKEFNDLNKAKDKTFTREQILNSIITGVTYVALEKGTDLAGKGINKVVNKFKKAPETPLQIENGKPQKVIGTKNQYVDKNGQYWIKKGPNHYEKGISPELHNKKDVFGREIDTNGKSKINKDLHDKINYKITENLHKKSVKELDNMISSLESELKKGIKDPITKKYIENKIRMIKNEKFNRLNRIFTKLKNGKPQTVSEPPKQIEHKQNTNKPNFVLGEEGPLITSGRPHTVAEPPKQIEYKGTKKKTGEKNYNGQDIEKSEAKVETKQVTKNEPIIETTRRVKKESTLHQLNGRGEIIIRNSEGKYFNLEGKELKYISDKSSLKPVKAERYIERNNPKNIYIKTPDGKIINPEGKVDRYATYNNSEMDLNKRFQKITKNKGQRIIDEDGLPRIVDNSPIITNSKYTTIFRNPNGTIYGVTKQGEYFNITTGGKTPLKSIPKNLTKIREN